MTDYESKHKLDIIREGCQRYNIHEVCFFCRFDCNENYSYWSGQMPGTEFCKSYEEVDET